MAKLPSINTAFTNAAKRLTEVKRISSSTKHDAGTMHELVWLVFVQAVLPEFGIDAKKFATDKETAENIRAARAAYDKAFDEPWCLESSNCGRHLAAHGYFRSAEKESAEAEKVFV
jgi:hypothetical protein